MKFSLLHNDKSTVMDEIFLGMFIIFWIVCGVLLVVYKPSFWIIGSNVTMVFVIICLLVAVMFIPALIYRLMTNEIEQ